MGKNCVQHVRSAMENTVRTYPHFPHTTAINSHQESVTHILTHHPTKLSEQFSQSPYTGLFNQKTERDRMLSTLSTQPITTTITYI